MIETSELKDCDFFNDFSEAELASLAAVARYSHWQEGDTIFRAGSPATNFYLLKSGSILLCYPNGRSLSLRVGGSAVGWSSLVSPLRYTASALCLTDSDLYQFPGSELFRLIQMNVELGNHLMAKIAEIMEERKVYRQRRH